MSQVEVFADVWCPFTHVGLRTFVRERADRGADDVVVRVRAWPLELVNGRPLDPDFVGEEIESIRAGLDTNLFAGFDPVNFPTTTLPALALTEAAYRASPVTGERVALEIRWTLFEEGRDIGARSVLEPIAEAHALDPATIVDTDDVEAEFAEGRARGVIGSPHFFTPDGDFFCPALNVERVDGHLRVTTDPEGFERFLAGCFGRPT